MIYIENTESPKLTSLADIMKEFHEEVNRLHKLIDKLEKKYGTN